MKANELADQIEDIISSLRTRILGIGADQYDEGNVQKIEIKRPSDIIRETIEEIDDSIVYLAHLRARMNEMKFTMGEALDLFDQIQPYASLNREMSDQIRQVRHLHRARPVLDEQDCCAADDEIWPCATIKALNEWSSQ
jgi:SMC interacting uncharacterized protein involved in chromosome segregation